MDGVFEINCYSLYLYVPEAVVYLKKLFWWLGVSISLSIYEQERSQNAVD